MRTPFIAGNWKMFKTVGETVAFVTDLRGKVKDISGVDIVVGPPFTALRAAADAAQGSNIGVSAQDMYWEREGAFTGEVSAAMIKEAGARYVIIGHSERRRLFGETNAIVNRKVTSAIAQSLTPIMCIGETLEERERNDTLAVLDMQIKDGLDAVSADQVAALVIAYEPVWAIGTGLTATPELAQEAHAFIKSLLDRPVLYGGSVKPDNAEELMGQPDVDGALVGGASLEIESFVSICRAAARSRS
jgi:triosephosphate isomerase (TIM)